MSILEFLQDPFILVFLLVISTSFLLLYPRRYYFKPDELTKLFVEIAKMDLTIEKKIEHIIKKLAEKYPGKTTTTPEWFLNYAGGILCPIMVLHCSSFEYILIWGTASGNEGLTGRHLFVDFYDTVLDGRVLYWSEAAPLRAKEFKVGDKWVHWHGDSGGQRLPEQGWCIEYARGPLISIMPFGIVSIFFNSLDFVTLYKTLRVYAFLNLKCSSFVPSFIKSFL